MSMRMVGGGSRLKALAVVGWTLVLLVALGLAAVAAWVRFDSGRDFVMRRLSAAVEMPLTAECTRIAWPYRLVAERVQSVAQASSEVPVLWVRTLQVGRAEGGWCLEAEAARLVLDAALAEGDGPLAGVAGWQGDPAGVLLALGRLQVEDRLVLRESSLTWLDGEGQRSGFVEGLTLRVAPANVPEYRLVSVGIDLYRAEGPGMLGSGERAWRWLSGGRVPFVDLLHPVVAACATEAAVAEACVCEEAAVETPAEPVMPTEEAPTEEAPMESVPVEVAPAEAAPVATTNLLEGVSL